MQPVRPVRCNTLIPNGSVLVTMAQYLPNQIH